MVAVHRPRLGLDLRRRPPPRRAPPAPRAPAREGEGWRSHVYLYCTPLHLLKDAITSPVAILADLSTYIVLPTTFC